MYKSTFGNYDSCTIQNRFSRKRCLIALKLKSWYDHTYNDEVHSTIVMYNRASFSIFYSLTVYIILPHTHLHINKSTIIYIYRC